MTGTDVILNRARVTLADTDEVAYRWTTESLIAWMNDGGRLITNLRPDSLLTAPYTMGTWVDVTDLATTLAIGDRYRDALADYVCSQALGQDGQDKRDLDRSKEFFKAFVTKAGIPAHLALYSGGR